MVITSGTDLKNLFTIFRDMDMAVTLVSLLMDTVIMLTTADANPQQLRKKTI